MAWSSTEPSPVMATAELEFPEDDIELISSPLTLPNGVVVPNRLVKAAMEEGLTGGLPGRRHCRLYRRWGRGGWGIILTGNVQVDATQPATPHDMRYYDSPHTIPLYHELHEALLADASHPRPLTLVQLSHAGMQSSAPFSLSRAPWTPAIAPVSGRPSLGSGPIAWAFERAFWPTKSRAIHDPAEWCEIAGRFVDAAACMEDAGWGGVQVHSAHGYLLAEYLSPLTNPYPRHLPGVPDRIPLRLHLLWLILTGIHAATRKSFVKALKINCSDFVSGGLDETLASDMIEEIVSWRLLDLLEISGGNYSNPAFTDTTLGARESLFAHFTRELVPRLPACPRGPAIMLTGGLHSRDLIAGSIRNRACDLAGVGRPATLIPDLPSRLILNPAVEAADAAVGAYVIPRGDTVRLLLGGGRARPKATEAANGRVENGDSLVGSTKGSRAGQAATPGTVKLVGASVSTFWHEWQMARMGRGEEPDPALDWVRGAVENILWWDVLRGGPRGWVRGLMGEY